MNKSRKIWLAISIIIIVTFIGMAPITVLPETSFLYSLIGAALLFISLTQLFGQFTSLKDLLKKPDKSKRKLLGRYLAPFMILPSIAFLFVTFFYSGSKKNHALETNGVLVKGFVSTEGSRKTLTSSQLLVQFIDSLGEKHSFYHTVLDDDFNNISEGSLVDVVYWREDPNIAEVILNVSKLSRYKKISSGTIGITNLTVILEHTINEDSINEYLNSINYEWLIKEKNVYRNSNLNLIIHYIKKNNQIEYIEFNPMYGQPKNENRDSSFSFEKDLIDRGYLKQTYAGEGLKQVELYSSDNFTVQKTRTIERFNDALNMKICDTYLISKVNKK